MNDLPAARSDLTATAVKVNGKDKIFLFGGCAADQVRAPWDNNMFYCPTITDRCDVFDPVTKEFNGDDAVLCNSAPRVRYRHTAVAVDDKVYLIGGVDGNDNAVKEIDVYDPSDGTWSVFGTWDAATTDLASFVVDKEIYIVGGYQVPDYVAQSAVYKFDTTADSLSLTSADSLKHARGDIFAAASDHYVYITGGWTHANGWANPLATVERWHLPSDHDHDHSHWERVANMTHNRGDKALMHMNGKIYAIGGENEAEEKAVKVVEVFDESTMEWSDAGSIVDETFRFVAVAHEPTESIYIFGGQNFYDDVCDCYKISNEVLRFVDMDWQNDNIDAGGGAGSFATLSSAVAGLALAFMAVLGLFA
ncbi:hypothetical protein TrRE_jg8174 [Triparma retinervis]|uniref:Uncharacterized protein n=1 Tax=Triparma retinervis TaxID=2557542 RepID=A0A9W7G2L0_9STRA|nr:hypothetical protein TrRE_jg8174 [Triparma retinervis]